MTREQVVQDVARIVAEVGEVPREEILAHPGRHLFRDLGVDSLLVIEIVTEIEKLYRVEFPQDATWKFETLDEAVDLTERLLKDRP